MKDDLAFIKHLLDSINAIEEFSKNMNKDKLMSDRLKRSAIVREIEIIGEAVKNISESLKNKHPEIEWKEIVGTRDKMIHHYFGVDLNIVWDIIKINLPDLKIKILRIKRDMDSK
ncbi:MAG TPA: DUF86 domain-containing protein [Candidatus Paceibacterota bacterium]|nr:DUF86 domain-containing protein [Candidatus Paceibacterota bacterium]